MELFDITLVVMVIAKLSGNALSLLVGDLATGESVVISFDVQVLDIAAGATLQNSVNVAGDNGSGAATDDGMVVSEKEPQNPCLGNCIVFAYRLPAYILLTLSKSVQR